VVKIFFIVWLFFCSLAVRGAGFQVGNNWRWVSLQKVTKLPGRVAELMIKK